MRPNCVKYVCAGNFPGSSPCCLTNQRLLLHKMKSYTGQWYKAHLCEEHSKQWTKWGWTCSDTNFFKENDMNTNEDLAIQKAILWLEQIEEWIEEDEGDEGVRSPIESPGSLGNARFAKEALRKYRDSLQNKVAASSKVSPAQRLEQIPHLHAYVAKLNPQNIAQFSSRPMAHDNIGLAVKEAERLAKTEPGHKFAVFTALGYYEVPKPGATWTGVVTRP